MKKRIEKTFDHLKSSFCITGYCKKNSAQTSTQKKPVLFFFNFGTGNVKKKVKNFYMFLQKNYTVRSETLPGIRYYRDISVSEFAVWFGSDDVEFR
jgi:hypothetical protein